MKRLLLLFFALFFISACAFVGENTKTPSALAPTLTSAAQTETPAMVSTLPASPTPFTQEEYGNVNLFCETYIETTWGSGPGQWGWPDGLEYRPSTLLPVKSDDAGRLYFADYMNLRLIRYDDTNFSPQEISLKSFTSEVPWLFPFRFSIDIYRDEILVPYGVDKLGVLDANTGALVSSIQLPGCHYDPYYPTFTAIAVDKKGRLYVFGKPEEYYSPIQSAFFEPGWENGEWKKIELPEDMTTVITPYFWDDYIVSEIYDVSTDTIILRQSSLEKRTSVSIDTGVPKMRTPSLFGVDKQGNAYLIVNPSPPMWTYAKYSLLTHQIQVGEMQLDTSYTIAVPSVSPDGVLYVLTYSNKDMSVSPRIIKCAFPNQ